MELTEVVLQRVDKLGQVNSLELANDIKQDHQKVIGAIKSLQTLDNVTKKK